MQLKLKNIGMIKEADVTIDGLTVIAGENDTGKSTVGKALFVMLRGIIYDSNKADPALLLFSPEKIFKKIFKKNNLSAKSNMNLYLHGLAYDFNFSDGVSSVNAFSLKEKNPDVIFIESPLIWNLQDYFQASTNIESHLKMVGEEIDIPYPYLMKDTYFKLVTRKVSGEDNLKKIRNNLVKLINGEFVQDDRSSLFYFHREEEIFDLINVATGIKNFGLLQVLLDNNRLDKNTVLVLDEPEVHLHPKWQLEMAKIIVELVKNGVDILVNSHSPYMIEALQRYSEREKIISNFYLAQDGKIEQIEDSNSKTLSKIFEKLSEPFELFEDMDSQRMERLING